MTVKTALKYGIHLAIFAAFAIAWQSPDMLGVIIGWLNGLAVGLAIMEILK